MRRREEHLLAAACHACNILPIWGLFTSCCVYYAFRDRSRYLRTQARQATIFHVMLLAALLVWLFIALLTRLFGFVSGFLGGVLGFINGVILTFLLLGYVLYCLWAALRCLEGETVRFFFADDGWSD
jgi:uncharacterized Tic20 family protein